MRGMPSERKPSACRAGEGALQLLLLNDGTVGAEECLVSVSHQLVVLERALCTYFSSTTTAEDCLVSVSHQFVVLVRGFATVAPK